MFYVVASAATAFITQIAFYAVVVAFSPLDRIIYYNLYIMYTSACTYYFEWVIVLSVEYAKCTRTFIESLRYRVSRIMNVVVVIFIVSHHILYYCLWRSIHGSLLFYYYFFFFFNAVDFFFHHIATCTSVHLFYSFRRCAFMAILTSYIFKNNSNIAV